MSRLRVWMRHHRFAILIVPMLQLAGLLLLYFMPVGYFLLGYLGLTIWGVWLVNLLRAMLMFYMAKIVILLLLTAVHKIRH